MIATDARRLVFVDRRRADQTRTSVPSEGWLSLLLHVLILAITADAVVRVDKGGRSNILIPLAIVGLVLGWLMARAPGLDAVSHPFAFVAGTAASFALTAIHVDGVWTTWHRRGGNVLDLARTMVEQQMRVRSQPLSDTELTVLIGLTLWLVGYSSAWMLYRRRWLVAALAVPAALIFVSLRYEQRAPANSIAAFAVAALVMAARHHAFVRQLEWARLRLPAPESLTYRFTTSGSVLAVIVLLTGWVLPIQAPNGLVNGVSDWTQHYWEKAIEEAQRFGANPGKSAKTTNGQGEFSDSFVIGKDFQPSDETVATLNAVEPYYLAVRRYDVYDGTTWSSGVNKTFALPGESGASRATSVTFTSEQFVALSPAVATDRQREAGAITVYQDTGGLLFTIETYSAASVPTVAVIGWQQIPEQQIDIESVDVATLAMDLQPLLNDLKHAQFKPNANGRPDVVNAEQAREIEQKRAMLLQYPVDTALSYDANGKVMVTVSGRVPNYDDIEAVYINPPGRGATNYNVVGSVSVATEEELRGAGTDYPSWITTRYLQRSGTETARTDALAAQIVSEAGATNTFDAAWAIQQYLRATFPYQLNSEETPKGQDAVDFFLFGKKVGRCEEFATSMVVMLRSQGIPARLVSGFRSGTETDALGDFVYRGTQLHTWVEVYFPKLGWIAFEPTPSQPPFDYGQSDPAPPESTPEAIPTPEPTPTTAPAEPTAAATPPAVPPATTVDEGDSGGWTSTLKSGAGLAMLLLTGTVALLVLVAAAAWAWGLRGLSPGASLYARVIRIGRLWGVDADPSMTPGEYATEFAYAVPKAGRAVQLVATLYTAERYGGLDISAEAKSGGRQAWRSVRTAVFAWRPWRRQKHRGR